MTKTLTLTTLLSLALLAGCATTGDTAKGSGNAAFDEAAKAASEKNAKAMKSGYAWTSAAIKTKYDDKVEAGKAFKETGRKLTLVDVALFEGEQALKKGDEKTAMKKVKEANELADSQLSQMAISSDYKVLWK